MGKTTKVIKVEIEKKVNTVICDCCGKDVSDGGYFMCSTCERYLCRDCFEDPKYKKKLEQISPRHPCKYCMEFVDEYYPAIQSAHEMYEKMVNSNIELQKNWGKRSRGELDA